MSFPTDATPTPASAPLYPLLPALPSYAPPDPLYQEKVAYNNALVAGAKVTDTAARHMFDAYLKHVESGYGKEGVFTPPDGSDQAAPASFKQGVMTAFKVLVEAVDPTVQVIRDQGSCQVKSRGAATPLPTADAKLPAEPAITTDAKKAFAGSDQDKVEFLNDKLRRLEVGDRVWIRVTNSYTDDTYQLATLTKFAIHSALLHGKGEAVTEKGTATCALEWTSGYSWPLKKTVFLPCWDEQESSALFREHAPNYFKIATTSVGGIGAGDFVFVLDNDTIRLCQVIEADSTSIKIHFCGWDNKWDERLDRSSSRIKDKVDLTGVNVRALSAKSGSKSFLEAMGGYFRTLNHAAVADNLKRNGPAGFSFMLTDNQTNYSTIGPSAGLHTRVYASMTFGSFSLTILSKQDDQPFVMQIQKASK